MTVVNFVVLKALLDPEPIVVQREHQSMYPTVSSLIRMPELLSRTAGIQEVLWNFAHLEDHKRITLWENPHFYLGLPTSVDEYGSKFEKFPVDDWKPEPNEFLVSFSCRRML